MALALQKSDQKIELAIKDNGQGFDANEVHKINNRLGLGSMKNRTELLGGSFSIKSDPGRGTLVSASWRCDP